MEIRVRGQVFRRVLDEEALRERVRELAEEVSEAVAGEVSEANPLLVIVVLNGGMVFGSDLARALRVPVELDACKVRSYHKDTFSGQVTELLGLRESLAGRHVLVVEDTVETGRTLQRLLASPQCGAAASLRVCTLIARPLLLQALLKLDFVGFEFGPGFTLGYGMDYDGIGRALPAVY
jgi:hypoxanthine phosphoribosyltransferase